MKLRRSLKKRGPRKDRKFIPAHKMGEIRHDVAVLQSQLRRDGDTSQYVSLHAWGCGCCFTLLKGRVR